MLLLQVPLHPAKAAPIPGVAVSVTAAPGRPVTLQTVLEQDTCWPFMAAPIVPVPSFMTVSETLLLAWGWKLAVTDALEFKARLQVVAVPVQAPDQPVNKEPLSAFATSVTVVPRGCDVLQVLALQATGKPFAVALTMPLPVPLRA